MTDAANDIVAIDRPYLLVVNIPLYRHEGRHWADPLWAKDLLLHLTYIRDLSLFCPVEDRQPAAHHVAVDHPALTIVAAPPLGRAMLLQLPTIAKAMDAAVRRAEIVHASPVGWPFPLGWLAALSARRHGRFLLINIESSFWRASAGAGPLQRLRASGFEAIARRAVNSADLALFTTDQYRRSLATKPRGLARLTPASWVDSALVLSPEEARASWQRKSGRLLFAGRLTAEKGVLCLLRALDQTQARVDIIGEGPLIAECRMMAERYPERVRLLPPVNYGADFFQLIDDYDAVLVPTLSDEQPRILFDAFARAVPAIVSDTPANTEIVGEHKLGLLFAKDDDVALARALDTASGNRSRMEGLGMAALAFGSSATHEAMHRTRAAYIMECLGDRRG